MTMYPLLDTSLDLVGLVHYRYLEHSIKQSIVHKSLERATARVRYSTCITQISSAVSFVAFHDNVSVCCVGTVPRFCRSWRTSPKIRPGPKGFERICVEWAERSSVLGQSLGYICADMPFLYRIGAVLPPQLQGTMGRSFRPSLSST